MGINPLRVAQMSHKMEKLAKTIETRIKRYHKDFSLPMMAELWEETLVRSMEDIGLKPEWDNDRSHKVGEDIKEETFGRISCKSGSLTKNGVKFNGSRTTKFKTIDEKIEFLSESHDDVYFLLAKNVKDMKEKNFKYKLVVFDSSEVKVNKLIWEEKISKNGNLSGWKGTGSFDAEINRSMSDQLWTTIPFEKIKYTYDIDANPV